MYLYFQIIQFHKDWQAAKVLKYPPYTIISITYFQFQCKLFYFDCKIIFKNLKFRSKEILKVSPVLVVLALGVLWSHPQAVPSFQACLVIKQVKQCFYFQTGRRVFVGYNTRSAFIKQLQNVLIHRTNNYNYRIAPPPPPRVVAKRCHTNLIQLLPLVIPLTPERHQGLGWH